MIKSLQKSVLIIFFFISLDVFTQEERHLIVIENIDDLEVKDYISINEVEEPPVYIGCQGNKKELISCLNEKIKDYVFNNFNFQIVEDLNIETNQKIFIKFIINKSGKIEKIEIKSRYKTIETEIIRIFSLIPDFIPGKLNGEIVSTACYIPIEIKVF